MCVEAKKASARPIITVIARPGVSPGCVAVRWRVGARLADGRIQAGKQGVVNVDLKLDVDDKPIIAELCALHHLLVEREILGEGRAGNGLIIIVSAGAIKKLKQEKTAKKHLVPFGRFLMTRFREADLLVSPDASWIEPVANPARTFEMEVTEPPMEVVSFHGIGPVYVTQHVIKRFAQRHGFVVADRHGNVVDDADGTGFTKAWRAFCAMVADPRIQRTELPDDVMQAKAEKHYDGAGEHYLHPQSRWYFTIVRKPTGLPIIKTAYMRLGR